MPSVTRKIQGRRAQRRDEVRNQLLMIVERLLADGEGFTEISVERLVQEAGISRSTFYVYFEDKGDLLTAWFAEIIEGIEDAAKPWWKLGGESTEEELRVVLDGIVRTYQPHTVLMAAMYDAAAYDPSVRDLVSGMMNGNAAALRKHIRAGQKQGFVDAGLPAAQTAAWLTWMAERGLHQLVRTASEAEVTKLVDAYTAIIWNSLYRPARG